MDMDSGINLGELLSMLKMEIKEWAETQMKLLQLQTFEKTAILGSSLIYGVIIINLLLFAFLFAFVSLSFLLGKWINSTAGGFAIIGFLYLVILILMLAFRKAIFTALQNLLLKQLNSEPDDESAK